MGGNCITVSCMIYTTHQLLFGWSNQGEKKYIVVSGAET